MVTRAGLARFGVAVGLALCAAAAPAMQKCRGADGRVTYQDGACPRGSTGGRAELPGLTIVPLPTSQAPVARAPAGMPPYGTASDASLADDPAAQARRRAVEQAEAGLATQRAQCAARLAAADPAREEWLAVMGRANVETGNTVPPAQLATTSDECAAEERQWADAVDAARRECGALGC